MSEYNPQPDQNVVDDPIKAEHMARAMDPHMTYASQLAIEASGGAGASTPDEYKHLIRDTLYRADGAAQEARVRYEHLQDMNKRPDGPESPSEPDHHFAAAVAIDPATGKAAGTSVATFDHSTGERLTPWAARSEDVVLAPKAAPRRQLRVQKRKKQEQKLRERGA